MQGTSSQVLFLCKALSSSHMATFHSGWVNAEWILYGLCGMSEDDIVIKTYLGLGFVTLYCELVTMGWVGTTCGSWVWEEEADSSGCIEVGGPSSRSGLIGECCDSRFSCSGNEGCFGWPTDAIGSCKVRDYIKGFEHGGAEAKVIVIAVRSAQELELVWGSQKLIC